MSNKNSSDHMANERTFLAWIRTSIAIMAFGFVVEKFALFLKQMAFLTKNDNLTQVIKPSPAYSVVIGFLLILTGAVISLLAFIKFCIIRNQINNENYRPMYAFELILTLAIVAAGTVLAFYLNPFNV